MTTPVRGMYDVLPDTLAKNLWQNSSSWTYIFKNIQKIANDFDLSYVRTPVVENEALFTASAGKTSDIVSKEMYFFKDRGERHLVLRPEGTAPIMRALQNSGKKFEGVRVYYIAPMFRYDRPQKGRFREHMQLGVEIIEEAHPMLVVEVIIIACSLLQQLGITFKLKVNFLCRERLEDYIKQLEEFFHKNRSLLSEGSVKKLESNPLRILDAKNEKDRKIIASAPKMHEFLTEGEKKEMQAIKTLLEDMNIKYVVDHHLVRGLDYYSGLVFETVDDHDKAFVGGGGYKFSFKKTSLKGVGFGMGIERILSSSSLSEALQQKAHLKLVCKIEKDSQGAESIMSEALKLASFVRDYDIPSSVMLFNKNIEKTLEKLSLLGVSHFAIIGKKEIENREFYVQDVSSKSKNICIKMKDMKDLIPIFHRIMI